MKMSETFLSCQLCIALTRCVQVKVIATLSWLGGTSYH